MGRRPINRLVTFNIVSTTRGKNDIIISSAHKIPVICSEAPSADQL